MITGTIFKNSHRKKSASLLVMVIVKMGWDNTVF